VSKPKKAPSTSARRAAVAIEIASSYTARALRYAQDVVAGKVVACRYVRLACERHLKDLERAKALEYPYHFDDEAAEAPCKFIEGLPHVKGRWARERQRFMLQDWQCFFVCVVFGWVRKRDGMRRFREVYAEIPRKNGKSPLAAAIGLFMWSMDGEVGAEVYAGATTEKQAHEVWRPAKQMLKNTPALIECVGAQPLAKKLVIESDESVFTTIIGKPGDGAAPSCAIIDEYHEHDTPEQADTMATGMIAREQPLLLKITTAGVNLAGPCYDDRLTAIKVLEGSWENEHLFTIIYTIDDSVDWTAPEAVRMANPNFGVSVDEEIVLAAQRQAVLNVAHQNRFKTKHLNVWCGAKLAWMPLAAWDACADKGLSEDEFKGEPCVVVVDLASKDDIAVLMKVFHRDLPEPDGRRHYYVFPKFYLPESAIDEDDPSPNLVAYKKWVKQELLVLAGEHEIDFDVIEADAKAAASLFQVDEFIYDPWRATMLAQHITKDGGTAVECRQTVQNLSLPMKEVLSAVKAGRIHHDGNAILRWMVSNVVAKEDAKENIYPRKEKEKSPMKIDGAVTLIMGMSRRMRDPDSGLDDWIKSLGPKAGVAR
jgi:phage terminase large subunit-like protein